MYIRKYYRKRIWTSAIIFIIMSVLIFMANNSEDLKEWVFQSLNISDKSISKNTEQEILTTKFPKSILPNSPFRQKLLLKSQYTVFFDESTLQARYTIHKIKAENTLGKASRYDIKLKEDEDFKVNTARWSDYSGSGYDRGHLVPAADFLCCQTMLNETFVMSNIAVFDSVLNRYAWQELEQKTRKAARKKGEIYVITGPIFLNKLDFIGKTNLLQVPTHFFKILVFYATGKSVPAEISAFLLPNQAIYHFDERQHLSTVDQIENLSELDFFWSLEDTLENHLEKEKKNGFW